MPIRYRIDHEQRVVLAAGFGEFTDEDVFGYQKEVWSRGDVAGYHELVDMTQVKHIVLPSPDRIKQLASLAASMDDPQKKSKFAIVAPAHLSFGLGRMFQMHRESDERSRKEVGVFRTLEEALGFLQITSPVTLPGLE
jgi:hypothetical protein